MLHTTHAARARPTAKGIKHAVAMPAARMSGVLVWIDLKKAAVLERLAVSLCFVEEYSLKVSARLQEECENSESNRNRLFQLS